MAIRYTFKAYERLKREQDIDTLFRTGKAFSVFPIKLIYHLVPRGADLSPARVGFSVPKKKFRLSVHRHRIRRQLAEAWRLNKHLLYAAVPADKQMRLFLIFTDVNKPETADVERAVTAGLERLLKGLKQDA